ncbi:cell wall-binding repeat-containing protein [Herbiconiux daphne]|uniref:Cell wall-binding repeat-containing protein n=1 Tax=Herbiconiux daphne TaxID=2970914 RepID=A0ABT2H3B5_9MICO|nr:cell wall-binding repeat-containing protein [Herbiconiux daphne]MCS5734397.1 cell wall-binding repeat-containing protein [Herbiconiux daphne]
MTHRSHTHRSIGSAIAGVTIAVAALLAAPLSASAGVKTAFVAVPVCPSAVAAVGFPVDSTALAPEGAVVSITAGTLPSGVTLVQRHLVGEPDTVGPVTFTVTNSAVDVDGTTMSSSTSCSIDVRPGPAVNRIGGSDRYQQALKMSQLFPTATTVYVASGAKYPDALSATAIAAAHGAPLLLTPAAALPDGVTAEIARLGATDVVVVGGEASVSAAALEQLRAPALTVTRIGGADRYEVSRNLISDARFGLPTAEKVYLATGSNFPDALTASPAAFVKGAPVMLVNGAETALSAPESALLTAEGTTAVTVVGGPNSMSTALETSMSPRFTVTRISGADRFQVGVNINRAAFSSPTSFVVASGTAFADALSGGSPAGISRSPLYVTQSTCLTNEVYLEIGRLAPAQILILGGTATLGADVEALTPCGLD